MFDSLDMILVMMLAFNIGMIMATGVAETR